ncbi:MAG: hypothetical protein HKO55_06000 [Gammaproteobacteria bacterium]|nr:hypothetical protein [Gammaproteobacteria bacterium]NNM20806.1 hypothetical protein [Gammaproteobacteria bacterium]
MQRGKTVDDYIQSASRGQEELIRLRKILLDAGLDETIKWGGPCYMHAGKNVVGLGAFKSYVGLWFFQGALLRDRSRVLVNAQSGKTRAMRQWRFKSANEIKVRLISAYLKEAMELAATGKEIRAERGKPVVLPPELKRTLARSRTAREAFDLLTPGRQREYADYIADAKKAETKTRRLKKILPMIVAGKGLNDKYKK